MSFGLVQMFTHFSLIFIFIFWIFGITVAVDWVICNLPMMSFCVRGGACMQKDVISAHYHLFLFVSVCFLFLPI